MEKMIFWKTIVCAEKEGTCCAFFLSNRMCVWQESDWKDIEDVWSLIVYKRDKVFCTNVELGRIPNLSLDVPLIGPIKVKSWTEWGQLQNLLYLPKKANFFKRKIFQMKKTCPKN